VKNKGSIVKKAVIPAAGLGTRLLPAAKAVPKEMLPVVDIPTIQYVVQEVVDSGIEDILIITGRGKGAIEDHFDRSPELEERLAKAGKGDLLAEMLRIAQMANVHVIRQPQQNGLGDAVLCARRFVGDEPFAVLLGDAIIDASPPATRRLIDCYAEHGHSILGVEQVPPEKVSRYGIVSGVSVADRVHALTDLVEKPPIESAPSNLAIAGRYVLTPAIFGILEYLPRGTGNEVQLTDALRCLLGQERIYSYTIDGRRFDIGDKLDYLKTQVTFGLARAELAGPFRAYLRELLAGDAEE